MLWTRLGAALVLASSLLALTTMWFLPHGQHLAAAAGCEGAAGVIGLLLAVAHPRVEPPSRWLLAFPLVIVASVFVDALVAKEVASAYTGFFTLGFIYVGLTQRRRTAFYLAPIAALVWWFCQTVSPSISAVKLPISLAVWLIVAEVLAARAQSVSAQIGHLSDEAQTDALTGLFNRRALESRLDGLSSGDVVVLFDLDHFKSFNDQHGHAAGDAIMREFAENLRGALRAGDDAYRYGGEEFVAILRSGDGTARGAVSMLRRLTADWVRSDRPTFSAGVAVHDGSVPAATLSRADGALYESKRAGRSTWRIHPPPLKGRARGSGDGSGRREPGKVGDRANT